ncbi:hypothetical protein N3K66_006869 [Trichothecium roseum]|uniref:Uncharacterized protein n=1 Tax=Trichothecium roseum TaxID=47278 RepID=A0ACC0UX08_9HYPO|nr:hypothetical protein N3K66_006869 [Trichothecium roseum]
MFTSIISLAFMGLAIAGPLSPRAPPLSKSEGFNLVVKLKNPSADFVETPVNGQFITGLHVGAGLDLVGVSATKGRIFYQNGTAGQQMDNTPMIVSDAGTPPYQAGLKFEEGPSPQLANINPGPGKQGYFINRNGDAYLLPDSFFACYEPIPYYHGKKFVVIRQSSTPGVPGHCVPTRLVPQCTKLNDLPAGATFTHEFTDEVPCYNDASSVKL